MSDGRFSSQLMRRVARALPEWHRDNHDASRFGRRRRRITEAVRDFALAKSGLRNVRRLRARMEEIGPYLDELGDTWDLLADENSKALLVDLIAYRAAGFRHVKLPTNTPSYWTILNELEAEAGRAGDWIDPGFLHFRLARMSLERFGFGMEAYIRPSAIMAQFVLDQYCFEAGGLRIGVAEGDVVLDCGGCWGETALHFAELAGYGGKVITMEFVPGNLDIMRRNLDLNPSLKSRIEVVPHPLGSSRDGVVYYEERGPATRVEPESFEGATGSASLETIDSLVAERSLPTVSFIKMDIEGAEIEALRGAEGCLRAHRPKLAISLYHSLEDFCRIPRYLASLDLGYRFFLKHATIHAEETVLFATPE